LARRPRRAALPGRSRRAGLAGGGRSPRPGGRW